MLKLNLDGLKRKLSPKQAPGAGADRNEAAAVGPRWKTITIGILATSTAAIVGMMAWDAFLTAVRPSPTPAPVARPASAPSSPAPVAPAQVTPPVAAPSPGIASDSSQAGLEPSVPPVPPVPPVPSLPTAAETPAGQAGTMATGAPKPVRDQNVQKAGTHGARALTSRSRLDARECLKLEGNLAVHQCAENFR